MNRCSIAVVTVLLVGGCATDGGRKAEMETEIDPLQEQLLGTIDKIAVSLEELSLLQQARDYDGFVDFSPAMTALEGTKFSEDVYLSEWYGPIETFLIEFCAVLNHSCEVYGKRPSPPIFISVPAGFRPAVAVLKSIGLQAGRRADIVLRKDAIELRYKDDV